MRDAGLTLHVGYPKAGSTWLQHYLHDHPDVWSFGSASHRPSPSGSRRTSSSGRARAFADKRCDAPEHAIPFSEYLRERYAGRFARSNRRLARIVDRDLTALGYE